MNTAVWLDIAGAGLAVAHTPPLQSALVGHQTVPPGDLRDAADKLKRRGGRKHGHNRGKGALAPPGELG